MFNNVKAKKRLTQIIVSFIVICMTLTGSFLLLEDSVDTVMAADRTVSTKGQWDNVMAEAAAAGGTWNVTLGGDIALSGVTGGKLAAVPANATVNLNMANHSIYWDYMQNGGNWNGNLMATSYTSGTYASGEYWGFITNNGTLNITGTGTIRNKKIHVTREKTDKDNSVQRLATIVNNGNLTVGGNITIESYLTSVHNSETKTLSASYSDNYLYNFGIYSSGGNVTSSAKIYVGGLTGASQTGTSGRAYNLCYGIYGNGSTKVNVTGGSIFADAFAGGFMETGSGNKAHMYAASVGVFGNSTMISGNTTINVLSKNWEYQDQNNNTWENGIDHLFSAGVMYIGANYPVIGPSVDVVASFEHIGDNKTQVYVPGAGDGAYSWSDVFSDGASNNTSHVATPVVGVSGVNANIGTHTGESDYGSKFFGGSTPWESIGSGADANRQYRTAQSYYSGTNTTVVAPKIDNGSNDSTRATAAIVNGAPGNTGSGGLTSTNIGNPGSHSPAASGFKKGSQYLVVYRYYKGSASTVDSVSFAYDSTRVDSAAAINVGGSANNTGIIPDGTSKIDVTGGAIPKNDKYFEYQGARYETVESANSTVNNRLNGIVSGNATDPALWAGSKGPLQNGGVEVSTEKDNVIIIYLDYKIKDSSPISVVADSVGNTTVNADTTNTKFSVTYKGAAIVPGVDFQLGIISTDATGNKNLVTGRYDIVGTDSSKVRVKYRYKLDGSSDDFTDGLPKDVGVYTIEVNVYADTTYSESSLNLQAKTATITGTISKASVDITGLDSRSGVYGKAYNAHIPFSEYKATGKGTDLLEGTWSFAGFDSNAVPDAGSSTVELVWTPKQGTASANNYNVTRFPIALEVAKKAVTVNAGVSTVTYGDSKPKYEIEYVEGLADCDKPLMTEYLNNSTFVVKNPSGNYVSYNVNEWAPEVTENGYDMRIETFGGIDNANYTFTVNAKDGKLNVTKRDIVYIATAIDRPYNGSDEVSVVLNYSSGNLTGDIYDTTINTTGKMKDANAGEGKQVTVNTDINIKNSNNYQLSINNESSLRVNIAKATPTGVKVVAVPESVVYDATATLKDTVALDVVENAIDGTWSWKLQDDGKSPTPTVDKASYKAVFTPADSNNYLTLEQDVNLIVNQKEVKVSVKDPKTNAPFVIAYGDPVPAISGSISYDGFTGNDNISNIGANGKVDATTSYTRGSATGKYAVNVISDLTSTNYYFTAVPTEITVAKKILTVTITEQSVTYGGPVPELNVTDLKFDGFYSTENYTDLGGTVVVTTTYTPGASVGEYKVTATGYTSDNYEIVYVDGVLTVKKAVLTVVPGSASVEYGADAPDYAGNKLYTFVDAEGHTVTTDFTGDPVFTTQYKSGKDAGSYPVTVSVNAMSATNYDFVGKEGTLTVVKANPYIKEPAGATVVNTHKYSEAEFDGTEKVVNPHNESLIVEGTFALVDGDTVAVWGNGGMKDVVFTPADTHNYNSVTIKTRLEILEKTVTGTPVIQGSAMAGSTLTLVLDSMDPAVKDYYTIEWYRDDAKISGVTGLNYTLETSDIGKIFKVKLIPDTDKGFTDGGKEIWTDPTSAVIEALLETTAAQFKAIFTGVEYDTLGTDNVFTSVEYDDRRHPVTVEIADAYKTAVFADDYVVKYNGVPEAPVNAGTYIVTLDIGTPAKPDGGYTDNTYGPATGIVLGKLEITKATLNISIAVQDKIYDGTTAVLNPIFAPVGLKDEMDVVNFAPGTKFVFADPNAGQNKEIKVSNIGLIGDDAGNYQVNPEIKVTANILPRTIYFEALNVEKDYDGTRDISVSFRYAIAANEGNDVGYAAVDSATSVYPINGMGSSESENFGTWKIEKDSLSCVLAGSSAKNYVPAFVYDNQEKVSIKKIKPVVELPVINGVTYSAAQPLSALNILLVPYETEEGSWVFMNDTIIPTVNQKQYLARYTPKSNNYTTLEEYITVNVEPLAVEIYPVATTITYGSKSPVIKIGPEVLPDGTLITEIGGSCTPIHGYYPGSSIGQYDVTLNNAFSDDNYKFTTLPGTLTVLPARLNVTAVATDKVYDGTSDIAVNFTIVSGKYANDDVSLSESSTIGQAATANAGQTTVEYNSPYLVGSKADNYEIAVSPASKVLPVTISKADVTGVIFPVDATVEFGYDLRYAEFAIEGIGDGTFAFENGKDIIPSAIGFYEYKVVFTPTDSRNYNTQERVISLEVVKCVLDYIVGIAGTPQQGETLAVVFTGLPAHAEPYVKYQWYRMNGNDVDAIPGATSAKYVATEDDIGYTLAVVTYVDEAQAPFVYAEGAYEEGFGSSDIRCIVGASDSVIKEITLTFWQRLLNWIRRIIAAITGVQLNGGLGG